MSLIITPADPDAVAYVDLTGANSYFAARANAAWAAAQDADKEAALVRATAAMDAKFQGRWIGVKATSAQALAWPRSATLDADDPLTDADGITLPTTTIPRAVRNACAEVALIELTERYLPTSITREQMIKRKKIDVIDTEYQTHAPSMPIYPHIDAMLQGLCSTGAMVLGMTIGLTDAERAELSTSDDPFDNPSYFEVG